MPLISDSAQAASLVLGAAKAFRNMGEEGKHQNTGYIINWFLKRVSLDPGYPWCMAFVSHCGYEGMLDDVTQKSHWPLPLTASCYQMGDWVKRKHSDIIVPHTEVARGQIFLLYYPELDGGRFGHTGFVLDRLENGEYRTIEGNTNTDGSRDGWQVCYKERSFKTADMIFDWTRLL